MSFSVERLEEADARSLDAAEILLDALDDFPSPVAFRRLIWEIARARNLAEASEPGTPFERLFLRHLQESWSLIERVARYRFEWPGISIRLLLDAIGGPGASDRLESVLADVDQQAVLEYLENRQSLRADRVSVDAPEARPLLEETTALLARLFREWLAALEGPLPGMDAEIVLGPGDSDQSRYEPTRHRVVLGPAEFMVFRRGGQLKVNPAGVARSLAHELAGHAVQDALSRDLPEPLRTDHRGRIRFATLPAAEGFADHRAALAVPFLEEHRSAFDLSEADLSIVRQMTRLAFLHHAMPACLGALAARARQERGFDPVAYFAERVGHPGFGERIARTDLDTVNRTIYNAACFFGLETVQQTAAELSDRGIGSQDAVRRLGRGGWVLSCYREAVIGEDDEAA
jgi:hypothetical protein